MPLNQQVGGRCVRNTWLSGSLITPLGCARSGALAWPGLAKHQQRLTLVLLPSGSRPARKNAEGAGLQFHRLVDSM